MKSVSDGVNTEETGAEKKPVDLFHFWWSSSSYRYTNHDERLYFNGNWYESAPIKRGSVSYDSTLNVTTLDIQIGYVSEPIRDHIIANPVEESWVQVSRVFRDMEPLEASVVFIGQVKTVSFQDVISSVSCVGFEHYLKMNIPTFRFQPQCNWTLFDSRCSLNDSGHKETGVSVTVDAIGKTLTATEFGNENDGHWVFGYVQWNGQRRMVISHAGAEIIVRYPFINMPTSGEMVDIWPGCDRNIETCRDKFDNVVNFGGHPYVPRDNPVLWT